MVYVIFKVDSKTGADIFVKSFWSAPGAKVALTEDPEEATPFPTARAAYERAGRDISLQFWKVRAL